MPGVRAPRRVVVVPDRAFAVSGPWMVEHRYASGWADAEWATDGVPDRFATKKQADAAIDEFIADTASAHADRLLADAYRRRDYRAVREDRDGH